MENEKFYLPNGYSINNDSALKKAYNCLCGDTPVVLLTGGAGTGKSTFINYVRNNLKKDTGKNCVVLAPTGVAAINVQGQTIHSFFHFPIGDFNDADIDKISINPIINHLDLIIIDEISQVESAMIDHINYALKLWRKSSQPFGGIQILFTGDYFQLSPYIKWGSEKQKFLKALNLKSQFFFDAHVFEKVEVVPILLEKIYRQKDDDFIKLLNTIRTCEDEKAKNNAVDTINDACYKNSKEIPENCLFITTKNDFADIHNNEKLKELLAAGRKKKIYEANIVNMSPKQTEKIATPEILELCEDATIMITRNIYDETGNLKLVNGDKGIVVKLEEDSVTVRIKNKIEKLGRKKWEFFKYIWDEEKKIIEKEVTWCFEQIPLKLGWAITIHKSQGMTLDSVVIEANESFASGQVYVALSRCKTLDGIYLKERLVHEKVFAEPRVKEFDKILYAYNGESIKLTEITKKIHNNEEEIKIKKNIQPKKIGCLCPDGINPSDIFMAVNIYNTYKLVKEGKLSLYDATRGAWFLIEDDLKKAGEAKYIVGIDGYFVRSIFSIDFFRVGGTDDELRRKLIYYRIVEDFRNRYEFSSTKEIIGLKDIKIHFSFEKGRPVKFLTAEDFFSKIESNKEIKISFKDLFMKKASVPDKKTSNPTEITKEIYKQKEIIASSKSAEEINGAIKTLVRIGIQKEGFNDITSMPLIFNQIDKIIRDANKKLEQL